MFTKLLWALWCYEWTKFSSRYYLFSFSIFKCLFLVQLLIFFYYLNMHYCDSILLMSACVCSFDVHSAYNIFTKKNCSTPRNINYTKKNAKKLLFQFKSTVTMVKWKKLIVKLFIVSSVCRVPVSLYCRQMEARLHFYLDSTW